MAKRSETPRAAQTSALETSGARDALEQATIGAHQVFIPSVRDDLFINDELASIVSRAHIYLEADAPVHFRGPAGVGKTTLALHAAAQIGRPVVLMVGDGWRTAAHLIGDHVGQKTNSVRDRYIHSVEKKQTSTTALWEDRALTIAMENGYTLVYDEFTRSPAEANNPLLMALEERMIVLPTRARETAVVKAHPEFRAIFTSNPRDYTAVNPAQDALLDRMITFDLGAHADATETGIVAQRSGLDEDACRQIVRLMRALRDAPELGFPPSLRAAIMIARVAGRIGAEVSARDGRFVQLCFDVLEARAPRVTTDAERAAMMERLQELLLQTCQATPAPRGAAAEPEAAVADAETTEAPKTKRSPKRAGRAGAAGAKTREGSKGAAGSRAAKTDKASQADAAAPAADAPVSVELGEDALDQSLEAVAEARSEAAA